jgi:diaminohydroxyphosphoribosylaminopyrimidine deaminase/5-amino-6-(5-phosphoribosylamino)uracil reductase
MQQNEIDRWHMRRALELAVSGQGSVEPNPMVGCVIAQGAEIIGEGFHRRFGAAHAEIEALRIADRRAAGSMLYATLEPCCHQGKTPPCTEAILAAGVRRVVVAQLDPFPRVQGGGIAALRRAGLTVEVGLMEAEARQLNAPYLKLITRGQPWIIAKWAMTLDGKIATHSGESRWISSSSSRQLVHGIRGRVDAILVGRQTAATDDPLLTARPAGPRSAIRVVLDTGASLGSETQLVRTARTTPLLVAVGEASNIAARERLRGAGCEVLLCPGDSHAARLNALLTELGRRRLTNVLVEGGSRVLGSFFDARQIDEVHIFVAPVLFGGATASTPVGGAGIAAISQALRLTTPTVRQVGEDTYITARCSVDSSPGNRVAHGLCSTDR